MQEELDFLNEHFQYITDEKQFNYKEVWKVMDLREMKGDCEDYALTLLYLLSGKSKRRMHWNLITRKARMVHYTHKTKGTHHAGLCYKGQYVDNITKVWNDGSNLKDIGYERKFTYPYILILAKFLLATLKGNTK